MLTFRGRNTTVRRDHLAAHCGPPPEADQIPSLTLFERAPAPPITIAVAGPAGATPAEPDAAEPTDVPALIATMLPIVRLIVADVTSRVPRSVDRDDLAAAGLLGLTQAARHYDPSHGVSFQVFARMRIRGAVLDELRGRDRLSRGARRRARQVSAATLFLHDELRREPTDAETANYLDVEVAVVRRSRDDVARAILLDGSTTELDGGDGADRADGAASGPLAELLDAELRGYLIDAVAALPDRLRSIVVAHFFDEREMQDIARDLGVTAPRVSQLCSRAVAMLRDGLNAQLDPEQVEDFNVTTGHVARRKHAYYRAVAEASSVRTRLDRARPIRESAAAA